MYKQWIDQLEKQGELSEEMWVALLKNRTEEDEQYAARKARKIADKIYGKEIYIRGLIEFTNYCKNDCYYCGIRRGNVHAERYRLSLEDILGCCEEGYALGFRTFVLQGGEDPFYTDEKIEEIVRTIQERYSDCAITLSIGERERESYKRFFEAGASRYLLRHETADEVHYGRLHPKEMSWEHRKE